MAEDHLRELGNDLQAEDAATRRLAVNALSERLRAADRAVRCEAAKALFEHFRDPLRRHIRCELARCRQPLEATGDAFQSRVETHVNSALLKLLERLEKGPLGADEEVHFLAYLKAIVANALKTRQRRDLRARSEPAELLQQLRVEEPSVVERLGDDEERQRYEAILAERRCRLTSEEQQLVDLYRAGLTYRAIAEKLGGSPGQYRAKMGRIIRKLR